MADYIIIGNGTAAASCIEGIRSVDEKGEITLVTAEPTSNYGRPLISYYLEGKTDLQKMKYRGDGFYADNGCQTFSDVFAGKFVFFFQKILLSAKKNNFFYHYSFLILKLILLSSGLNFKIVV